MRNLEERVREYELHGVQASSSLQTAAKGVMLENTRLRLLLRRRGVKDAEIESYLDDETLLSDDGVPDRLAARSILPSSARSTCDQGNLTASCSKKSHQMPMMEFSQQYSASKAQPPKSARVSNAEGKGDVDCPRPSTALVTNKDLPIESRQSPSKEHTVRLHSSIKCLEKGNGTQNNMTPCMEAAMIIVSMNAGLSLEEANAELGCPPVNDCYVDNLTVFRVMDR